MVNRANITDSWLKRHAADPDKGKPPLFSSPGLVQERWWDEGSPGFGVVIGKRFATFVVQHRVNGDQRMHTIGRWMRPMEDGQTCTVERAWKRARVLLGAMASGVDPVAVERAAEVTLRQAFDEHKKRLENKMKAGKRSQATIDTIDKTMARREVADLLDRPLAQLNDGSLAELHERIKKNVRARKGAKNEKGAPVANRVISNISAAWNTMNKKLGGKLGTWNPAKSVDRDTLLPGTHVIVTDLADWHERVQTMRNPIQRDGLLFALFTGLRHEDVRTVRFDHVDEDESTLRLPDPKGGPDASFTIPLPAKCLEIIERRRTDNPKDLARKSDEEWVFPGVNGKGDVGPIGDLRQQVHEKIDDERSKHSRFPAEDVHTLRRTYTSVADDLKVPELVQHVLTNHTFGSRDVHSTYITHHRDTLTKYQDEIAAGLQARIDGTHKPAKRGRAKLRAVS